MEKKGILIALMFLILGCSRSKPSLEQATAFYKAHKDVDFEVFKCYTIMQWNQNRKNDEEEYIIEFYPDCQSGQQKALRGKVKFKNGVPVFHSDGLVEEDLPPQLLEKFYVLQVSNLFYKNSNRLELTLYPDVRLLKDCNGNKKDYSSFDRCWHYRIINQDAK